MMLKYKKFDDGGKAHEFIVWMQRTYPYVYIWTDVPYVVWTFSKSDVDWYRSTRGRR